MSASVKISRVCAKVIPIKMFLGHGMDQIQRATLSLAICVFSAADSFLVSSSSWVFLEGFELNSYCHLLHWSEDITPKTFIHCIIFPVSVLIFMMFIANFLSIHIRV